MCRLIRFTAFVALLTLLLVFTLTAIWFGSPGKAADSVTAFRLGALDPKGCPMPCWMGIQPGVTTMLEAVQLIHDSPYIDPNSITPLTSNAGISFKVNWKAPDRMLNAVPADASTLTIDIEADTQDRVKVIFVPITVQLGDFVRLYGAPERTIVNHFADNRLFIVLEYARWGLQYSANLPCRLNTQPIIAEGSVYLLQARDGFVSQGGGKVIEGWHGFSNRELDRMAQKAGCS